MREKRAGLRERRACLGVFGLGDGRVCVPEPKLPMKPSPANTSVATTRPETGPPGELFRKWASLPLPAPTCRYRKYRWGDRHQTELLTD